MSMMTMRLNDSFDEVVMHSWLYLSRLAAAREYSFMVALAQQGLPVPAPVDHNRHAVLMSLVDAIPLAQVQPFAGLHS